MILTQVDEVIQQVKDLEASVEISIFDLFCQAYACHALSQLAVVATGCLHWAVSVAYYVVLDAYKLFDVVFVAGQSICPSDSSFVEF